MPYDRDADAYVTRPGECAKCGEPATDPLLGGYCAKCVGEASKNQEKVPDRALAARQELAARELCRRRLLPFTQRLVQGYTAGWFHKLLAKKLEEFSRKVSEGGSPRLLLSCPPRHGKQISDFVEVFTTEGWKTHGELRPGDYVFHPSGKPVEVLQVHPPGIDTMEVEFTNGEVVQCHEAHEWTVRSRRKLKTVETRWLAEQPLWLGERGKQGGRAAFQVPLVEGPLELPEQDLPLDPYVLGAWLGDGTCGKPLLTNSREDYEVVVAVFGERGVRCTNTYVHRDYGTYHAYFGNGALEGPLRTLGVYHEKSVPEQYLRGSVDQRLALLAGLVDTDGYVDPQGRVRFSTTSEALRDAVVDLCTTLNFRPYIASETEPCVSSSGIEGRCTTYQVGFQPTMALPTRVERKQVPRIAKQRRVAIRDVRRAKIPAKGRCITVDSDDGLYLVGRTLIPTHNSELASKALVAWHLGRNPTARVISAAHSDRLAVDNSRDVLQYIKDVRYKQIFADLELSKDQQGAMGWRTSEGGVYKPVGVGAGVAGYGANMLILDDIVRDQDAYSPTVRDNIWNWYRTSARTRLMPGGGIIMIGTRWVIDDPIGRVIDQEGTTDDGGRWEYLRFPLEAEEDEYLTSEGFIVRGEHDQPDAKLLRSKDELLDTNRWTPENFVEHKQDPVTFQALFQQSPTAGEAATFSYSMFDEAACVMADIPEGMAYYSAWDTALGEKQVHDYTACVTGGLDSDGNLWIVDVEEGRFAPDDLIEAIIDNYEHYKVRIVGVEKTQFTVGLKPAFERRVAERNAWSLPLEELAHGNKDKVTRARPLQARMRRGYVRIPTDAPWYERLRKQMIEFPGGRNDDMVDALSYLAGMLESMISPQQTVQRPEPPSWTKKLGRHVRQGGKKSWRVA